SQSRTFSTVASKASFDLSTSLIGPSVGWEIGAGFSVGLSVFYQLTQVTAELAVEMSNGPGDQASREYDNEITTGGHLPVLGVLWRGPYGMRAGFSWSCETITLHGTNAFTSSVVTTFAGSTLDTGVVRSESRYPHRFA